MAKSKNYRVRLTGRLPLSSVSVPGAEPSMVVGREWCYITAEQKEKLEKAVEDDLVNPVVKDNLEFEEAEAGAAGTEGDLPHDFPGGNNLLSDGRYVTVHAVKDASNEDLDSVDGIGTKTIGAIREATGQDDLVPDGE